MVYGWHKPQYVPQEQQNGAPAAMPARCTLEQPCSVPFRSFLPFSRTRGRLSLPLSVSAREAISFFLLSTPTTVLPALSLAEVVGRRSERMSAHARNPLPGLPLDIRVNSTTTTRTYNGCRPIRI